VAGLVLLALAGGCDQAPHTAVILENGYPSSATQPLVVYQAYWQAVAFTDPLEPGASSAPQTTEPTSAGTAYVVLAPGWDPELSATPTSFVVMQSSSDLSVSANYTLRIPVNDTTFAGNCAAGSFLTQAQADFITQRVFPCAFASFTYDAATCTVIPRAYDAGVSCDSGLP
jgi:hypothetical protein